MNINKQRPKKKNIHLQAIQNRMDIDTTGPSLLPTPAIQTNKGPRYTHVPNDINEEESSSDVDSDGDLKYHGTVL